MDNDENLINNFANTLRDHPKQRTFSLYSENHSRNDAEKYEIKDVISSVAEQLKAIQNADSLKKCPSGKGITNPVKRSTFLPVNMVPVEHPPPQYQSHKFETQCVLDTQLINVIEDAEAIIDAEKGITQEFDTTFCYKDQDNCKIAQKPCTVFKNNHTIDKPKINLDSDKTTDWSMCDSKTVKHVDVVNGMTQEFDTTFCHKDLDNNIEENNDCHKNEQNNNIQVKNDNIHTENYRGTDCGIVGDTFKIKCDEEGIFVNELSLTKEKALTDVIIRNFAPETNVESNSIDICDNFDMQSNFYFGACEDDNNNFSQTEKLINHPKSKELEEPKSPILNNIRPKAKSNTPSSLIFELQSFENFEMIALPIIENYDFETAKRVINSQILNRELFIHSHAEAVLGDRDKNIQKNRPILKSYMKSEIPNAICTENKLNLTEDSMLFSSDEENDATNNLEEIPLKCNLQNSFDNETDTLEGTMYVGFQTASNKSIQIPTAPYHKAKTIFDNLVNIKKENRSETNFVEASETIATIRPWLQLNHVNMKSTTNIHADRFTTANSETLNMSQKTSNVSHPKPKDTIPYCVDQVKNNGKNMSDDSGNLLQLHDLDISDNNKIKLSEKINPNQANSDPIANVQQNNKIKDNISDKNYTEHLQIDDELMNDHILAEFNTDLIPDTNLNKIDKLTKCDKALKATNNVVKETELDLNLMKPINKDFVGFRTANKKMIKISAKGLMKTKNIFENIDNDDPLPRKSEKKSFECPLEKTKSKSQNFEENNVKSNINNSEVYFRKLKQTSILQGFKTAKQPVAISIQKLNKAKKIFQNIDSKSESLLEKPFHCAQNVELNEFRKFTTASNKTVEISGSASAKTINIDIQNQDIENKQEIDNLFDTPACDTAVQSSKAIKNFTSTSNTLVKISESAVAKTKHIIQEIDNETKKYNNESKVVSDDFDSMSKEERLFPNISQNAISEGFKTASNKFIKISTDPLIKTKKIFEDIFVDIDHKRTTTTNDESDGMFQEKQPCPTTNVPQNVVCQGFKTAANKSLGIPAKALAKSKKIFRDLNNEESNIVNNFDDVSKEKQPYPLGDVPQNVVCQGFKTASNKLVKISTEPLIKTKQIFQDIFIDVDHKRTTITSDVSDGMFQEKQPCPTTNVPQNVVCQGFKTAANKPLGIPAKALAKSKNIFRDLNNEESNIVNNFDDVSKEKQPYPIGDIPRNVVCQGFKTASNKSVEISTEPLIKTKQVFQDIFIDVDHKRTTITSDVSDGMFQEKQPCPTTNVPQNVVCQGFKTAANKPLGIPAKALAKSKNIFRDLNNEESNIVNNFDDVSKEKQPYPIGDIPQNVVCRGFKTASNKSVEISIEPLIKTKQVFQDIFIDVDHKRTTTTSDVSDSMFQRKQPCPITNIPQIFLCQGFKTAANEPLGIPAKALAKSKKIFQDLSDEESNSVNYFDDVSKEKKAYPIVNISQNDICQGFKTAGNKLVKISTEPLIKTKQIFQDICIDVEHKRTTTTINDESDSMFQEKQPFPVTNMPLNVICQGFKTAANKPLGIPTEALAKSKKIFRDLNDEESNIENDFDDVIKANQPYPDTHTPQNAMCKGFKTTGNKPVEISEEDILKSKKAVENVHKDCKEKQIRENVIGKQPEIVTKKQMNFIGFHTAFYKKVEVSENALLKSRQALQNIDSDLKSVHFDLMKTGNNTVVNVSEEALRKCGNKFSESGVISEKDVFEDFNTEIIKDFEDTVCTEDFIKDVTPKGKRSGSPILSFPNTKKKKKFETPFITKKFVAPINRRNTIDTTTTDVYEFNENYKKIKQYTLKDVNKMDKLINIKNVDPYISNFQFETLLDFVFIRDRNDIDNDKWTTDKIKQYFSDSVNKRFIPDGWIENHLKMIIWKLVSYEIRFPEVMKNICTVRNVLEQLKYRYKRELYNVERPALRKILEKDEVSTKGMVLCVAGLFVEGENVSSVTNQTQNIELLLTDGWYTIKASSDRMIDRLVCEGKITVGMKLAIHGAELLNCEQGKAPWEDTSSVRLKIWGNSTRRARWDARLGFHGRGAIPSRLSAVRPEGGRAARLRALVTRVYPTLYIEKYPDGSTLTRSERLEDIHQMKYETERQMQMERLYEELQRFSDQESQDSEGQYPVDAAMESGSQISRLMKKSRDREEFRAQLTSSQAGLLQQYASKQREKLAQDLQDRFRRLVEERGLDAPRNVVPLVKIRVADVETRGVTKAMVTIWKPNEILLEMLTEGTWIDLYNVVPTSIRYSEIQISAGRQSTFRISKLKKTEQLQTITKTLKRQCYTTKDLQNPSMNTDYNEVDTVGLIFMIEPQTIEFEMKNHTFQNVYLTDADKNIICVNFWGGIEKFGFQNILETGQVVACVNLQKRAGNTRKTIPQYRATEFTYFTKAPKNESVRKMAADLTAKFSCLDKRKFIDDCVVLRNNYHNFKCGNIENVSPYRLNTSDYNVYKNKVFIDSPLVNKCTDVNFNLTGLDFESTFKQTDTQELSQQTLLRKRKVNEKIAKLKMYGEPPPLSTIHLINKSTIKSFKSPFTKSDISANVASPSAIPHNRGENKSNADDCHQNRKQSIDDNTKSEVSPQNRNEYRSCVTNINALPQNRVDNIDSSPVYSLNRTYVKRPSINPVKLNFSNAIDTSITDPFGEDFDGSPPLSLDVNFIT